MNIEHDDQGAVATVTVTSTVFEFRRHNRVVDAALFLTSGVVSHRSGMFFMKSVISGKSRDVLRAYRTVQREASR